MNQIIRITFGLTISCLIAAIFMGSVFIVTDKAKKHNEHLNGRGPIYLGIGDDDIYNKAQMLLAEYLPPERVIRMPGGHRFSTFKQIWDVFLDKQILK